MEEQYKLQEQEIKEKIKRANENKEAKLKALETEMQKVENECANKLKV